jgi:hypothetical protein
MRTVQRTRNRFMQTIGDHVNQTNPDINVNLHSTGNLRVSSGKTSIQIQLWINKDNEMFLGVSFGGNKGDVTAEGIVLELLRKKGDHIREKTGHKFIVHHGKGKPGYGWIESEIIYDVHKSLEQHVGLFSSEYVTLVRLIRDLLQDF